MKEWTVKSNSKTGKTYKVEYNANGWFCDCPAVGICKHIKKVRNQEMGERTENEHLVQLSRHQVPVSGRFGLGDDIVLKVMGSVVKVERSDNHDGTHDIIYKIKTQMAEVVEQDNEDTS